MLSLSSRAQKINGRVDRAVNRDWSSNPSPFFPIFSSLFSLPLFLRACLRHYIYCILLLFSFLRLLRSVYFKDSSILSLWCNYHPAQVWNQQWFFTFLKVKNINQLINPSINQSISQSIFFKFLDEFNNIPMRQ